MHASGAAVLATSEYRLDTPIALSLSNAASFASAVWRVVGKPRGATATLTGAATLTPTVDGDVAGRYTVSCTGTASDGTTNTSRVALSIVRTAGRGIRKPASSTAAELLAVADSLADDLEVIPLQASQTQHVPTATALRALTPEANSAAILAGRTTRGDGGGGAFYYDPSDTTTADDGGETCVVGTGGYRWKRAAPETSHVVTGGDEDLGPIINARILAAAHPTNGFRVVEIPQRKSRWIATPIRIHDDDAGGNAAGITLRNQGGAPDGTSDGLIVWNGANGGTMIEAHARGTTIEGLTLRAGTGSVARAISATWASGAGARNMTKVRVRNTRVEGGGAGTTYGVVIGDLVNGEYPLNCDYLTLEDVYFDSLTTAGVYIPNTSGQVKACRFVHCSFYNSQYGIRAFRAGYSTETCGFSALTVAAVYHDDACDMLRFYQTDSENCARFLDGGGVSGAYWPVTIDGGRFDCTQGLAANGRYISKRFAGPLNIVNGARFDCQANTNWHIYAATGAPGGTTVDTQGVLFPRRAADDHAGLVQGTVQWSRRACDVNDVGRLGDVAIT